MTASQQCTLMLKTFKWRHSLISYLRQISLEATHKNKQQWKNVIKYK